MQFVRTMRSRKEGAPDLVEVGHEVAPLRLPVGCRGNLVDLGVEALELPAVVVRRRRMGRRGMGRRHGRRRVRRRHRRRVRRRHRRRVRRRHGRRMRRRHRRRVRRRHWGRVRRRHGGRVRRRHGRRMRRRHRVVLGAREPRALRDGRDGNGRGDHATRELHRRL